jgi:rsbT co-antagonist protein RsbR
MVEVPQPPEDREALRDLWDVYDAHHDEIAAATVRAIPEGLAESIRAHRAGQQSAEAGRRLMERAMLSGEWTPYVESIRELGAHYARNGLEFEVWPHTILVFQRELRSRIAATLGGNAQRLARCLGAMEDFVMMALLVIGREYMAEREATIRRQRVITEFSTPVLVLRPGLLLVPVVGVVDPTRAVQLSTRLLEAVGRHRARAVVIDVTGVPSFDAGVAAHLAHTVDAARLMGARSILTGLSAESARVLGQLDDDLSGLTTERDLQSGIERADHLRALGV